MISRRAVLGATTAAVGMSVVQPNVVSARGRHRFRRLERHLQGDLILPSDPGYATAKQLELMQFDVTSPRAIAYCVSPEDVSTSLRYAQDHRLPIAVRSGGHSYGGYSTTPGLVIDVSRLNAVTLDGNSGNSGNGEQTVSMGPGAQTIDVLAALSPHGLAVTGGACPTVAAGGFLQGGGLGFLTRSLGMGCDKVTSAEVVLANGRVVTASEHRHSDLFWALRGGGGGNFGVVTKYTMTPAAINLVATASLAFPYDRADEVLDGYTRWLADAPRTIGGAAFVTLPDAAPGAAPTVAVSLVSTGTPAELQGEVSRLLSLTGAPVNQSGGVLPYQALMMNIFGCAGKTPAQCHRSEKYPEGQLSRPAFSLERTRLFDHPVAGSAWSEILSAFDAGRTAGQMRQLQVLPLGGAVNDLRRGDTAYVHRDTLFTVNYLATIHSPQAATAEAKDAARTWVDNGFAAIDPYSNGETYQNYIDPALRDWKRSYYAENYWRLAWTKVKYDPYRMFRFDQGIRLF